METEKTELKISEGQQAFLDAALSGKNIFLTGKAGTGKSFIVKYLIQLLRDQKKKVAAIAPTGVAANNIGGQTIHSMFSINTYGVSDFESCNFLKTEKRRMINAVDTFLIDEISMVRPDVLDAINFTMLKNGCGGLEKKQIILIGDMKQLPPILKDNTRSVLYSIYDGDEFWNAKIYKKLNVENFELTEVLRQSDPEFIDALNIVREGGRSEYFRKFVHEEPHGIILAAHNSTVEEYNKEGLAKINQEEIVFNAIIEGNAKADEFNLQSEIRVKNGAKIMYLANSQNGELINGTMGVFVSHSDCHYIRVDEVDYALKPIRFAKKEYVLIGSRLELREIGAITQYPIKLAYALSIHKSQGLTFDTVTIDLSKPVFQKEQLYVALSRVKTPEGLRIKMK